MAKEHLGEAGWKALTIRHKLKDETLGKALVAWLKAGKGTADERLAAIDGVSAAAKKLQKDKACSAKEEVAEWLDAAVKEALKVRGPLEVEAKSAAAKKGAGKQKDEAPEPEAVVDEEGGDLGSRLLSGLNKVKNGKGDVTLPFVAFPAKPAWALGVAPRISPELRGDLKESVENPKTPITGTCVFKDGKHTFVVNTLKPGMARGLAAAIKAMTTKKWPVAVTDGKTVIGDDADADDLADDAATTTATGTSTTETKEEPKGPDPAAVEARRQAIVAKAKILADRKEIAATVRSVALAASEAGVHIRKGDLAAAVRLLDQCDTLLASVSKPQVTQSTPAADEPKAKAVAAGEGAKAWQAARSAVVGRLKEVQGVLAASKHPERDKAILQFTAVARQLTGQPSTPQQIAEMQKYIAEDDVVADICDIAFDMKTPLLGALATLRAEVAPSG